jgi:hypothetical protein
VAPGNRDNSPIWLTVVCGIVGVLIGYGWLGGTRASTGWRSSLDHHRGDPGHERRHRDRPIQEGPHAVDILRA